MAPAQVPKVGGGADEGGEGVEEAIALQVAEEGGGFASGDDEAGEARELVGATDEDGLGTELDERVGVFGVRALQGQDADLLRRSHLVPW